MAIVALLQYLFRFAGSVVSYLQQRQLVDSAQAAVLAKNLESSLDTLTQAIKAREAAAARFRSSGGVPDDSDPNLRD